MHFGPSTSELYCTLQCQPESNIKVTRIKEMITNKRLLKEILLVSTLYSVENSMENIHTDDRV